MTKAQEAEQAIDPSPRRRMVIVGPVRPFRGGIAQHTTQLSRALAQHVDLLVISFARQYPNWLFPGQNDRDPCESAQTSPITSYVIDSLNPITWWRAVKTIDSFRPDLVVIPWWTAYWAPCFGYIAHACKCRGRHVCFLCHNVVEHETAQWRKTLTKAVLRQGHSFAVHSHENEKNLRAILPDAQIIVYPHPVYDQFPKPEIILPRRADLELLFFGFIRPYKGLDVLIEAMGLMKDKDIVLTVAGEFWSGKEEIKYQIKRLEIEDQVELIPRYVSDQETASFFERADAVVLPYRSVSSSGVIAVAFHYGKPVIVTELIDLPGIVINGETGFIVPSESPSALANLFENITASRLASMSEAIKWNKGKMTWDGLAERLIEAI